MRMVPDSPKGNMLSIRTGPDEAYSTQWAYVERHAKGVSQILPSILWVYVIYPRASVPHGVLPNVESVELRAATMMASAVWGAEGSDKFWNQL